jgi:fructokinase
MDSPLLGSLELGGTKAVVAVARNPLQPLMRQRIATGDPEATLSDVVAFFRHAAAEHGPVEALGIASFGPIDIRRGSPDWGRMGRTPKPGWTGAEIGGRLERELDCPLALDTDVNGAGLAEARWGAGQGLDIAYLTVGTGIGGGLIIGGTPVHGAMHPEIGHVRLRRHPDDPFPGRCPFHGDCAEGLASGPAIMDRFGATLEGLGADHPFRGILADYLGQLCATLALVACPERIVIGGGVMVAGGLHAEVEQAAADWLAFYVPLPKLFIVPPALGEDAGLVGGFALAQDRLQAEARSS